ncbi:MAG: c-type cytochrome [Epsilonproteobacteria bacterium]|nr:c-type cytochrome [Campylobacterota bacterium]
MRTLQIASISLITALLLVGCGSSSNGTNTENQGTDNNNTPTETPAETQEYTSDSIQVLQRDTSYITDADGNALYRFDNDTLGVSNCTDVSVDGQPSCLDIWPIFTAEDLTSDDLTGLEANASHTAFRSHPLYYFTPDENITDTKGDWVKDVWHLVYPPMAFNITPDVQLSAEAKTQNYVTDDAGMALYTFDKDEPNKSNCTDESIDGAPSCLSVWPIAYLDVSSELPVGTTASDFGEILREDGKKQTTYKQDPLYYFTPDTQSGDVKGDWVKGVWHLVEINPAVIAEAEKIALGRAIFTDATKCASCHGADGQTPPLGVDNVIARYGDAELIASKLIDMRDNGNPQNRSAAMVGVAQNLSDEAIENLSAFIATLKQ